MPAAQRPWVAASLALLAAAAPFQDLIGGQIEGFIDPVLVRCSFTARAS